MLRVSAQTLKILSGSFWYIGAAVLVLKGSDLLFEAESLRPGGIWPQLAIAAGLFLGTLKAIFIFNKFCRNNLARIAALEQPRIWQFFRPRFFVMLFVMILVGAALSRLAHNNYPALIGVAVLDLSIASALIGGSYPYWRRAGSIQ